MKKILMVSTIPETLKGFLLPFARHFRSRGWQVDAMACGRTLMNARKLLTVFGMSSGRVTLLMLVIFCQLRLLFKR